MLGRYRVKVSSNDSAVRDLDFESRTLACFFCPLSDSGRFHRTFLRFMPSVSSVDSVDLRHSLL